MARAPSPIQKRLGNPLNGTNGVHLPVKAIRKNKPPRRKIAFGWYGGKFSHLGWLLPQLPYCKNYCEPFGGSASVLLNRAPSLVETFNDLDGEIVNFFRV